MKGKSIMLIFAEGSLIISDCRYIGFSGRSRSNPYDSVESLALNIPDVSSIEGISFYFLPIKFLNFLFYGFISPFLILSVELTSKVHLNGQNL